MSAKYEELVKAGAPRLPEGYYYKIYKWESAEGRDGLTVSVRRRRAGWFDKRLAASNLFSSQVTSPTDLAKLCRHAWNKAETARMAPTLKPFLGRHP